MYLFSTIKYFCVTLVILSTLYLCGCENAPVTPPEFAEEIEAGSVVKVVTGQTERVAPPRRKDFGESFSCYFDWEGMDATEEALLAMTVNEKQKLKRVGFRGGFTDKSMEAIQGLENIEELWHSDNEKITEKGMLFISTLPNLKEIYYSAPNNPRFPYAGKNVMTAKVLRELTGLPKLRHLRITSNLLSDECFQDFTHSSQLKSLTISGRSKLTHEALKGISKIHGLERIVFQCEDNWNGEGLDILKNNVHLKYLSLSGSELDDEGLKYLESLHQLSTLILKNTNITDQGLESISHLSNLTALSVRETKITDAGMAAVSQLTNLEFLYFNDTAVTKKSLVHIKKLSKLRKLGHYDTVDSMIFKEYMKQRKESLETSE